MLIDAGFFEAERKVIDKHEDAVKFNLLAAIAKYEDEFLTTVLGDGLASAFLAGIAVPEPEQRWKDLRDGAAYVDNSLIVRHYPGLIRKLELTPAVGETPAVVLKLSPIADYVYYHYVKSLHEQMTAISVVKNKGENSVLVSPARKLSKAWNDMAEGVQQLYAFLYANHALYNFDEYGYWNWFGSPFNGYFWNPYYAGFAGYDSNAAKRLALAQKMPLL